MSGMTRFTLKDILRGITLTAIGLGMLAAASKGNESETSLARAFLIAFGGMFIGYGFAFSIKWPPYQMICAMVGMFAAQAWYSGSSLGLIFFVVAISITGIPTLVMWLMSKKGGKREDKLGRREE